MFGRSHETAVCIGCRRVQPLKCEYCRLCWCQARLDARTATGMPTVSGEVMTPWLQAVRHHQLFFVGLRHRRGSALTALHHVKAREASRRPPPVSRSRPRTGWRQLPLFEQVPRDYGRLDPAAADLASPWLAWAKHLAHQLAEARGWGRGIRFAVNRGLAIVLTGYTEGDVIRHSEIFSPLRALDLRVGHVITVLEEMGIFLDDEEPFFERWLAERREGIAPGIAAEAERWTRVLRDGGPRSLPRQQATVRLCPTGHAQRCWRGRTATTTCSGRRQAGAARLVRCSPCSRPCFKAVRESSGPTSPLPREWPAVPRSGCASRRWLRGPR